MAGYRAFFFGDSHTGAIRRGARLLGLPAAGSATMRGRLWYEGKFQLESNGHLHVESETGREHLARSLAEAGARTLFDLELPIITTVAFLLDPDVKAFASGYTLDSAESGKAFVSEGFFKAAILARRRRILDLLARLQTPRRHVLLVTPPPRQHPPSLAAAMEDVIIQELGRLGIATHRTREWSVGPDGLLLPEYVSAKETDLVHGNNHYGSEVMRRIAPMLGIELDPGFIPPPPRRPRPEDIKGSG